LIGFFLYIIFFIYLYQSTEKMKNIILSTQGIKGGDTKTQNVGFVIIELRHDQDRITVDDFEGMGLTYKQREQQKIEIIRNGNVLFSGTKNELFEILEKCKEQK
jgi:hypothetical protein